MRALRRIAIAIGAVTAAILYVWIAAVRAAPGVRRRKAEARRQRGR